MDCEGDPDPDILSMAEMGFESVELDVVGDLVLKEMFMGRLIELLKRWSQRAMVVVWCLKMRMVAD